MLHKWKVQQEEIHVHSYCTLMHTVWTGVTAQLKHHCHNTTVFYLSLSVENVWREKVAWAEETKSHLIIRLSESETVAKTTNEHGHITQPLAGFRFKPPQRTFFLACIAIHAFQYQNQTKPKTTLIHTSTHQLWHNCPIIYVIITIPNRFYKSSVYQNKSYSITIQ